jgi:hypothetical protein
MFVRPLKAMVVLVTFHLAACVAAQDLRLDSERAAIQEVLRSSIDWAVNKDTLLLYSTVADDSSFFIYHPDSTSTIVGIDSFRQMVTEVFLNPAFRATGSELRDLRVFIARSRTVAWFSAILDDHGEWDGTPISWINVRWTGVLERRHGRWVIVQMHFSFAA